MSYCDLCGIPIEAVPYRCRHCEGVFCPTHRLQELHECKETVRVAPNK